MIFGPDGKASSHLISTAWLNAEIQRLVDRETAAAEQRVQALRAVFGADERLQVGDTVTLRLPKRFQSKAGK